MLSYSLLFVILATTTPMVAADSWGGAVSLGPTQSTIIKAVTYVIPGDTPPNQTGELFLWPGMSNGTGDLVQTSFDSYAPATLESYCGAATGQWCLEASLFGASGQINGPARAVSGDAVIRIEYALQSDGSTWLQTASDNATGAVLSTLSSNSGGYMRGWGTGTECNGGCVGTTSAQAYLDTKITLASADPSFGNTIVASGGATYEGFANTGGGLVWTIARIDIPPMITLASTTVTTATATHSTTPSSGTQQTHYGQCGGQNFVGPTACSTPYACSTLNPYYAQCL